MCSIKMLGMHVERQEDDDDDDDEVKVGRSGERGNGEGE